MSLVQHQEPDDRLAAEQPPLYGKAQGGCCIKNDFASQYPALFFFYVVAGGFKFITSNLGSVMSSIAALTPSRPIPESFTPPYGI